MNIVDKLNIVAENTPKVFEAGKDAQYNAFWDIQQANGALENRSCDYMFAGQFWTKETCVPKYDMISPYSTYMMFALNPAVTDMREFKKANGEKFVLNTTGTKDLIYTFYRSKVTYVETIDATSCTALTQAFNLCPLETIELLILKENGSNTFSSAFGDYLKNITIQGTIGNTISFPSNVLTKDSIYSITNALSNTTSAKTITFRNKAVTSAFGSVDSEEWKAIVASKPNWTFALN